MQIRSALQAGLTRGSAWVCHVAHLSLCAGGAGIEEPGEVFCRGLIQDHLVPVGMRARPDVAARGLGDRVLQPDGCSVLVGVWLL